MKQNNILLIISIVNFIRGGKSSIARLIAEMFNTTILNFDTNRNAEHYNVVNTVNVLDNSTVTKKNNKLEIETDEEIMEISNPSNFIICDFGGRFDERIGEFQSDLYILPTMDDYESISETIKATKYILKHNPKAKIIHVLNMAMCSNAKEKEEFRIGYTSNMEMNKITGITVIEMPKSKLIKNLVNKGLQSKDIMQNSKFLENGAYKQINAFVKELINLIEKEIQK
jgi:hypothetical protein